MAGSGEYVSSCDTINATKPATMQPTCDLEQHLRARLDSVGVFSLTTDNRFFDTVESHLPAHRERIYPPTETRMVALSCAATGAIIDALIAPGKGKATGELLQMRTLARSLTPGDVLVGDAIYETYWTFVMLPGIGCDGVFEINGSCSRPEKRRAHLTLNRPDRPEWTDAQAYESCPK